MHTNFSLHFALQNQGPYTHCANRKGSDQTVECDGWYEPMLDAYALSNPFQIYIATPILLTNAFSLCTFKHTNTIYN